MALADINKELKKMDLEVRGYYTGKKVEDDQGDSHDEKVLALMQQVDEAIPTPTRETDKPFLMPVEDTFSIAGRGTVVTGRVESGVLKTGDEVEILGLQDAVKTTCTGVEMFKKQLERLCPSKPMSP